MCTVSVIPLGAGFRVVCNRDERHERADASTPRWRSIRGVRVIYPADGEAGGTWIAASERGVVLALLNVNLAPDAREAGRPRAGRHSRGKLIPLLAPSADAVAAIDALREMDLDAFEPFRMVSVDRAGGTLRVLDARWDRRDLTLGRIDAAAACFVSSGLGDERALPRLDLFRELVVRSGTPDSQDAFHNHAWPDRREISVMMHRDEARTVSVTGVEVEPRPEGYAVKMRYRPVLEPVLEFAPHASARVERA